MLILDACTNISVLGTILFFKKLVHIISIIVPILLVLLIAVDFAKAVMANSDDDMKREQSLAIKRIIAGLIVFFVPLIVDTAFTALSDKGGSGLSCYNNATESILNPLIEVDKANLQLKEDERQQFIMILKEQHLTATQALEQLKTQSSSNSNNNISPSTNNSNSNRINIFIGDSRTVSMRRSGLISSKYTVAKDSQGYSWFNNTVIGKVNKITKSSKSYNIISWFGVNDLHNCDKYYNKYASLAKGKWKNHMIYVVSVGTIRGNSHGRTAEKVNKFNSKMKKKINNSGISNLKYIELTFSEYPASDQVHYTTKQNKKIYKDIMSQIS